MEHCSVEGRRVWERASTRPWKGGRRGQRKVSQVKQPDWLPSTHTWLKGTNNITHQVTFSNKTNVMITNRPNKSFSVLLCSVLLKANALNKSNCWSYLCAGYLPTLILQHLHPPAISGPMMVTFTHGSASTRNKLHCFFLTPLEINLQHGCIMCEGTPPNRHTHTHKTHWMCQDAENEIPYDCAILKLCSNVDDTRHVMASYFSEESFFILE